MEMLQTMLKYAEVHTNMKFEKIPTMPLELRAGIEKVTASQDKVEDDVNIRDGGNPIDGLSFG